MLFEGLLATHGLYPDSTGVATVKPRKPLQISRFVQRTEPLPTGFFSLHSGTPFLAPRALERRHTRTVA